MLEKDYLIRYLNALFEALQKLKSNVESSSSSDEELKYTYALLGGDFDFFKAKDINDLIEYFEERNNEHLESIHYLSKVLYFDALTQNDKAVKLQMLEKSKELNYFYSNNTMAYNFLEANFGDKIEAELKKLQ